MDVNATLVRLVVLAGRLADGVATADEATEAGELFLALHEWMTRGGFVPAVWAVHRSR